MFGAIFGDIIGSIYEFNPIKSKDFKLFHEDSYFTDDSVCTVAVADILLSNSPPAPTLQKWCRQYINKGYGGMFYEWLHQDIAMPYGSYGNGAAMRVSPAAFLNQGDLTNALAASDRVTEITHNHPEGIKGARATTHTIWLALNGATAAGIRAVIADTYHYDLSPSVDDIRPEYAFNETCQQTVPQAIVCALEATDYEDAVRNAVSLGGDADTLAAIAGAIAEAMFSIPQDLQQQCETYLEQDLLAVMRDMYRR